jgi:hypothetical protein
MLIEMFTRPLFAIGLPGHAWTMFALTTIVMITGGAPFLKSAWAALRSHNANMDTLIAIGTSTAYLYSLYAMAHHQPVFFEVAAFVITFILLGQVLEDTMKGRANGAIEKLLDLQAKDAEVIRDGKPLIVPLADIITGDIIRVKPGQKIAVDGIITEGSSRIDESMVTGESMPVTKQPGDTVIGATINTSGTLLYRATKVGADTLLAQIVEMVRRAQASRAPIQKTVDTISGIFVPAVLIIAIVTFAVWFVGKDDTRFICDGAGDGKALFLSAGQVFRLTLNLVAEFNRLQRLAHTSFTLALWNSSNLQWQTNIVVHTLVALHEKALKNKTDFLRTEAVNRFLFQLQNIFTIDDDLALFWPVEPTHRVHQRGLAATRLTEYSDARAIRNRQTDIFQRPKRILFFTIGFRHIFYFNHTTPYYTLLGAIVAIGTRPLAESLLRPQCFNWVELSSLS